MPATESRTIHIYYEWNGERYHRAFPDKKRAYRWFYYLCPAQTGECVEEIGGRVSAPKRLRKRPRRPTSLGQCFAGGGD